jgi:hypothetical protein
MGGSLVHDLQNEELGSVSSSAREKMKGSFAPGVPESGGGCGGVKVCERGMNRRGSACS